MPPHPPNGTYGALCALHSLTQIIGQAAKYRIDKATEGPVGTVAKNAVVNTVNALAQSTSGSSNAASSTSRGASGLASQAKDNAKEARMDRMRKRRMEREAEEEEFKKILNTRWEDRNPGVVPMSNLHLLSSSAPLVQHTPTPFFSETAPTTKREDAEVVGSRLEQAEQSAEAVDFSLDVGKDELGIADGSLTGSVRANELNEGTVELEGKVEFKVQVRAPVAGLEVEVSSVSFLPTIQCSS